MILMTLFVSYSAWTTLKDARFVSAETVEGNVYLDTAFASLDETAAVGFALSRSNVAFSSDLRALGKTAAAEAQTLIMEMRRQGTSDSAADLNELIEKVRELRGPVAAELDLDPFERDPGLARDWVATQTALIMAIDKKRTAQFVEAAAVDPKAGLRVDIEHAALLASVLMAQDTLLLAEMIRDELPMSPRTLQTLAGLEGQLEVLWADLSTSVSIFGDPNVTAAMDEASRQLEAFRTGPRSAVIREAIAGNDFSITGAKWNEESQHSLDLIANLARQAQKAGAVHLAATSRSATAQMIVLFGTLLLSIAATVFAYYVVLRGVVQPLAVLTSTMRQLADGDTQVVIPGATRRDEIGEMAATVAIFRDNAVERERLEDVQQNETNEREHRQTRIEALINGFRDSIHIVLNKVGDNVDTMRDTATVLTGVATETSGQVENAANSASAASQNVQTVAAAAEELTGSISAIRDQVVSSIQIVSKATEATTTTQNRISGLASAAERIGDVISLIQGIAEQTNLLALNATIEAARAGEAGKGFSVVAAEVKTLANQTAKATEEISQQVAMIQSSTEAAVAAVQEIGAAMDDVNSYTNTISAAIEEQGGATGEISQSVQEAWRRTRDASHNVSGVSQSVAQTNQSAGMVQQSATDLTNQAQELREEVDKFLSGVAAA